MSRKRYRRPRLKLADADGATFIFELARLVCRRSGRLYPRFSDAVIAEWAARYGRRGSTTAEIEAFVRARWPELADLRRDHPPAPEGPSPAQVLEARRAYRVAREDGVFPSQTREGRRAYEAERKAAREEIARGNARAREV